MASASWYTEERGFFGPGYLREYADLLPPERTTAEIDFLEQVVPLERGAKILDLACGHGRHAIELARRGYAMTGQDLNAFFLQEAARAATRVGVQVRWVQRDMREIPVADEFAVVLNLFSSFGYLESDAEDQQVIRAVQRALRRGGKFVLEVASRERAIREFHERDWAKLTDGSVVLAERQFDFRSGRRF